MSKTKLRNGVAKRKHITKMEIGIIFATGLGKAHYPELAEEASALFVDKNMVKVNNGNFKTSLKYYNGRKTEISSNYTKEEQLIVDKIKDVILQEAEKFFEEYGFAYDKETSELVVTGLWINEMESNPEHEKHQHYGNMLSGCFYVDVPEGAGGIRFTGPLSRVDKATPDIAKYTVFNSHSWTITPEKGNMLLWESYLMHQVVDTQFTGKRRSIAFDVSLDFKG
jgi:uncharacterized protein (TIGR02466 family)